MNIPFFVQSLKPYARYAWVLAIAAYLSVSAVRALQTTYQSQGEIADLQKQLTTLQQEKTRYQALAIYFQTDAYREKELRRALVLAKPGERVYALPENSVTLSNDQAAAIVATGTKKRPTQSAAGRIQSWVAFVVGDGRR